MRSREGGPPCKEDGKTMARLLSLQGTLVTYEALNRFGDLCGLNPTGVGSGPRVGLEAWKWKREAKRGAPFAQARVVPSSGSKEKDLKDFDLEGRGWGGREEN